jgi:hypothetical protein
MKFYSAVLLLLLASSCISQWQDSESAGNCHSAERIERLFDSAKEAVLGTPPPCPRGAGAGLWHRIARLNMSDPGQQCPSTGTWRLVSGPVRSCGQGSDSPASCDSVVFPSNGYSYSRVCGRINAVNRGATVAFHGSISRNPGLEGAYVSGVSLTHGAAGSRQHIWTFAAALYQTKFFSSRESAFFCPCTSTLVTWQHQIPSFIGNNYFCDTGNPGPRVQRGRVYSTDPMWDGEGCSATSTCCQLNNPPWFCTTLPRPTTDDIELRICRSDVEPGEDVYVQLVDLYVM